MNLMGKTESDPLFLTTVRNQCLCFTFEENYVQTHDINIAGLGNKPSGHPCFFYFDNVPGTRPDTQCPVVKTKQPLPSGSRQIIAMNHRYFLR